eukprot:CAMPEP_0182536050 /NCGR_PEP_ID=MMETSP1323-20130603/19239_1 /TAXON_ID=236787 /ORGANISM="Florenciella parvula, Strain RCC1693" /LENGTH=62 /DNA_ID=CAMNT_0024746245 /DNA_START=35 /DNA_END=220 /DNA_ORIENTATION=+
MEFVAALQFINTRTYSDERIRDATDSLLVKATGSRRAARTEHLPQIAVRQGVGQEYADAINL